MVAKAETADNGHAEAPPTKGKVGRRCTICRHADRDEIDREVALGGTLLTISRHYAVSQDALARHRDMHIPTPAMRAGAVAVADADHGGTLLGSAAGLRDKAMTLLAKAEVAGDLKTALAGVREAARCLELMAKLTGQIDDSVHLNVLVSPVLQETVAAVLMALAPYPAARLAVSDALGSITLDAAALDYQP